MNAQVHVKLNDGSAYDTSVTIDEGVHPHACTLIVSEAGLYTPYGLEFWSNIKELIIKPNDPH